MKNVTEINKPIVDALRMSAALPGATEKGRLHVLYGDQFKPVGYLAHIPSNDMGIRGIGPVFEDRFFATESLQDAIELLKLPHDRLPGGAKRRE